MIQKYKPTNIFALALRIYIEIKLLNNSALEEKLSYLYASIDEFSQEKKEYIVEMSYILLRAVK